jgi:hypothetical protein
MFWHMKTAVDNIRTVASCPHLSPSLNCYTARKWNRLLSNATVKCIIVLLQIREVPYSKLDQDTGCQKRILSCLPTVSPAKCRGPRRVILNASLNTSHVNKQIIILSKGQRKHDVWLPQGLQIGQASSHMLCLHMARHLTQRIAAICSS